MRCCICGKELLGCGNNPHPVVKDMDAECCDECNDRYVIPARLRTFSESLESNSDERE